MLACRFQESTDTPCFAHGLFGLESLEIEQKKRHGDLQAMASNLGGRII